MKLDKAKRRERKQNKKRKGMQVDNRSIFTIVRIQVEKAQEVKREG